MGAEPREGQHRTVPSGLKSSTPETRFALGAFTKDEALRELVESFFQKVVADLADRVRGGLPPPGGGS
jgi:hypothetical protein